MNSLDDVFGDKPVTQTETPAAAPTPEPAPAPAASGDPAAPPAASVDDKLVPLSALDAERKGRKDWKEKALRIEGENALLKHQLEQAMKGAAQQPQPEARRDDFPDPILDPEGYRSAVRAEAVQLARAERLNEDEESAVEKHGKDAVEAAFAELQKDPAEFQRISQGRKPWTALMKWAEGRKVRDEIGDDPAAFRARIEKEIREKIAAEAAGTPAAPGQPQPLSIPQSLATTPSVQARSAPAFTGPTPLSDIFDRK